MIRRDIQAEIEVCRREYPVICITGPRQSGKTTLALSVFSELQYVSFEEPVTRDIFAEDPKGFLGRYRDGAVFDEVQHVPALLSYLQVMVDASPVPGRFILTGSQHFGLVDKISQSLAGRTAVLELLPFSVNELERGAWLSGETDAALWNGAYPPVHDRGLRPDRWYANYMATYIQRDVRQLSQIQDLDVFTRFMRLCAGGTGQLVNTSRMGTECGVDHKTIRRWLAILQASYVVGLLPSFHRNFRKRVVKTPKLFFYDTGLVCHLLGIENAAQLATHPLRGAVFETWVFSELNKSLINRGERPNLYFWRTHSGQEVDFVLERGGVLHLVEAKSGTTVTPETVRRLESVSEGWEKTQTIPWIVYGGSEQIRVRASTLLPWQRVFTLIGKPRPMRKGEKGNG